MVVSMLVDECMVFKLKERKRNRDEGIIGSGTSQYGNQKSKTVWTCLM